MATWKKVYTTGDSINVSDGGTGLTAIPNGILVGTGVAGQEVISGIGLSANQILMGVSGSPATEVATTINAPTSVGSGAHISITGSSSGSRDLSIGTGVVTGGSGGMLTNSLIWDNMATVSGIAGGISLFATAQDVTDSVLDLQTGVAVAAAGEPFVLTPPGNVTQYLVWDGDQVKWATVGSLASTVTVTDVPNDATARPVVFTDGTTDSALNTDNADLTYKASTSELSVETVVISGLSTAATVTAAGPSGDTYQIGFIGNATAASQVKVTEGDGAGLGAQEIYFGAGGAGSNNSVYSSAKLHFDEAGGTNSEGLLTVPNLTVSGTTSTVNSTEVNVADKNITLAVTASTQDDAATVSSAGGEPGLSVYISEVATVSLSDAALPHVRYMGTTQTAYGSGWAVGKWGSNTAAIKSGVATMQYANAAVTAGDAHIGIGAFKYGSNGLWIQTSIS